METLKVTNEQSEKTFHNLQISEIIEKEVEMDYFENYNFDGDQHQQEGSFQSSCRRISYCSCNCHRCDYLTL